MECKACRCFYNEDTHIPRLLIFCGHSVCEKCLATSLPQTQISCPECSKLNPIEKVEDMPKNLALLHPYVSQSSNPYPQSSRDQASTSPFKKNYEDNSNSKLDTCQQHRAKYQAYCLYDKVPICLQCILGDAHKQHEFIALPEAAELQKEYFKMKEQEVSKIINLIEIKQRDVCDYEKRISGKAESRLKDIQK